MLSRGRDPAVPVVAGQGSRKWTTHFPPNAFDFLLRNKVGALALLLRTRFTESRATENDDKLVNRKCHSLADTEWQAGLGFQHNTPSRG